MEFLEAAPPKISRDFAEESGKLWGHDVPNQYEGSSLGRYFAPSVDMSTFTTLGVSWVLETWRLSATQLVFSRSFVRTLTPPKMQKTWQEWPADQQSYKLVKRTGSGYSFTAGQSNNFTYVQAIVLALWNFVEKLRPKMAQQKCFRFSCTFQSGKLCCICGDTYL